jgi:ribonuclease J
VHASGHAYRDEQAELLELLRPRAFVPVHGTRLHLQQHAELARELGVAQVEVVIDGQPLSLDSVRMERAAERPIAKLARGAGRRVDDEVVTERRRLAFAGVVVVILGPDDHVMARPLGVQNGHSARALAERVAAAVWRRHRRGVLDVTRLTVEEQVRRAVRRALGELLLHRPLVDVTTMAT